MGLMPEFWRDKHVLVTGHTGFKGSWLCLWLTMLGAKVTGYSLAAPTRPSLFEDAEVAREISSIVADIRDLPKLQDVIRTHAPQIVFHLAAQSLVRRSYLEPAVTYDVNVMGTVNLLDAVRTSKHVRCVIAVTSDKCYENPDDGIARVESDRLGGHDPYSNSKACAELVVDAYRRSFFSHPNAPSVVSVRAGNVVGGGDWGAERLIPDLIRSFMRGESAAIRNPNAMRPWQHVLDPLRGYLMLAHRGCDTTAEVSRPWNLGPYHNALSVANIADMLSRLWGDGASWRHAVSEQPMHEARTLALNAEAAAQNLGWKQLLSVEETMELTIAWYRSYARDSSVARQITLQQIDQFMHRTPE